MDRWVSSTFAGINLLDEMMNEIDFFKNRLDYKYAILERFISGKRQKIFQLYNQFPAHVLYELIRQELLKVECTPTLTAFLFSRMNIFEVNLSRQYAITNRQNQIIQQLQRG